MDTPDAGAQAAGPFTTPSVPAWEYGDQLAQLDAAIAERSVEIWLDGAEGRRVAVIPRFGIVRGGRPHGVGASRGGAARRPGRADTAQVCLSSC
ncbi:hypothetical protein [Streptomyces viridochromogenes]|uniref:hypothetical protein n=1 Tax=Streptomyces viridochromogenes TaxID=1938 RepID=UPI00069FCBB9|nr:hypothetical protein [Streptomyces viridochromogenes]KOG10634.1 hypothetical protein ADK36_38695 [Streptomyces viridochromogenes]KOG17482.1 hypothetical protein ADK35_23920 [Streptomyces viridochromogenes]